MTPIIEARGVTKRFSDVAALTRLDLPNRPSDCAPCEAWVVGYAISVNQRWETAEARVWSTVRERRAQGRPPVAWNERLDGRRAHRARARGLRRC